MASSDLSDQLSSLIWTLRYYRTPRHQFFYLVSIGDGNVKVVVAKFKVLGMGETWTGGDIKTSPGGGQKVKLLREALEPLKEKANLVVLFTDR